MATKIIIAGDVVVSPHHNMDVESSIIDQNLIRIIQEADYSIVNFEAPVKTSYSKPIQKTGPNLYQNANVIDLLKNTGFNCFTLANNHFRDYGQDACENTLTILQAKEIDCIGGGKNIGEASNVLYKEINDCIVAFINVCEREWSIATDDRAGSNPLNVLTQYYQIKEAKKQADFVILIYHGGVEHYRLPSPEIKKLHHLFIDAGADAVINHHQHCFSGYEVYNAKPIFYGIGNFLFDDSQQINKPWNFGFVVQLNLDNADKSISFELIPYEQCNGKFKVNIINNDKFNSDIRNLNEIILNDNLLNEKWKEFVAKSRSAYGSAIIPYRSRILRKLCSMKLLPTFVSANQLRFIYDVINCDSHRVRFLDYLENKLK